MSNNSNLNNNAAVIVSDAQAIGSATLSARGQARLLWQERVRDSAQDMEDMLRAIIAQMSNPLDTGKQSRVAVRMVGAHAQACRALRKLETWRDSIASASTPDAVNAAYDDVMDTIGRLASLMPVRPARRDTLGSDNQARLDAIRDCLTGIRDVLRNAQREAVRSVEPDMLPTLERINKAVDAANLKRIATAQEREAKELVAQAAREAEAQARAEAPAVPAVSDETVIGQAMHAAQEKRAEAARKREARKSTATAPEASGK